MPSNNFLEFDSNSTNMMTDSEYNNSTQIVSGVQTGIAASVLHNKLFRQTSLMAATIAKIIELNGDDILDSYTVANIATLLRKATGKIIADTSNSANQYEVAVSSGTPLLKSLGSQSHIRLQYLKIQSSTIISTASWAASGSTYVYTFTLNGVVANDLVFITPNFSSNATTAIAQKTAWNNVSYVDVSANTLKFVCLEAKPSQALNLSIVVVG